MWIKYLPERDRDNSIALNVLNKEFFFSNGRTNRVFMGKKNCIKPGQRHGKYREFMSDCINMEKRKRRTQN